MINQLCRVIAAGCKCDVAGLPGQIVQLELPVLSEDDFPLEGGV
jgi:hypothetical protein